MMERPMEIDLPYCYPETDKRGNIRIYVRRNGRRIRIRQVPGSPAFLAAYNAALEALAPTEAIPSDPIARAKPGSLAELAGQYFAADENKNRPMTNRRQIIEHCLSEPFQSDDPKSPPMGDVPAVQFGTKHARILRDRKSDKPGAANNRLKYLSAMFTWAVEHEKVPLNPLRDVKRVDYASDGFHTWTRDELTQFEKRHPIGTKARLAMALLLFTGCRRGDVVQLGKQHVKGSWLHYVPAKTRYRRVRLSKKPILPALADIIARSPTGDLTFLVTEYGRPFTPAGFGGWFRERCDEAGLPQCTAHGLKKIGASMAAENGATLPQLQAMFDWDTPGQAQTYIKAASRERLAGDAMHLILSHSEGNTPESETKVQDLRQKSTEKS